MTDIILPVANRGNYSVNISPLIGDSTPGMYPLSTFITVKVPTGTILFERQLYNTNLSLSSANQNNSALWYPGTYQHTSDTSDPNNIHWEIFGITEQEYIQAINGLYNGSVPQAIQIAMAATTPKVFFTTASQKKAFNPSSPGTTFPKTLPIAYPTSRDFFYSLSLINNPLDFLNLVRLFDLYRKGGNLSTETTTSSVKRTSGIISTRTWVERQYTRIFKEINWQNLPEQVYGIFELMLFGWTLNPRQSAAKAAISLTDEYQVRAAFNNLAGIKAQLYNMVEQSTSITLIYPDNSTTVYPVALNETEKARFRKIIDNIDSYLQIQMYELAARGAQLSTPEAPYTPTSESVDWSSNVNLVYDTAASNASGVPIFNDISVNSNLQFNATVKPIVDNRIPLVAWQKAPEMIAKWSRTEIDSQGFALAPIDGQVSKSRSSIVPYVIGALAVTVAVMELRG